MKKQLLIACMFGSLIACGTNNNPNYYKVSNNILEVPSATTISTRSMNDFAMPENDQTVTELAGFKVRDDIYDSSGEKVIIPKHAVISALYTNDGTSCTISWKSVYVNEKNFDAKRASFSLKDLTEDSACAPTVALKKGNVVNLKFR